MKSLLFISFFVFAFSIEIFAQTNKVLPCLTVTINSPNGIPPIDAPMTFSTSVKNTENSLIEYNWTAINGEILEGQGTPKVTVKQKDFQKDLTVKIEAKDITRNCTTTETESVFIDAAPQKILIDEFSIPVTRIDTARLDNLSIKLQDDPAARAYIIEGFEWKSSGNAIKSKIQRLKDYLFKLKKIEKDRVVILIVNSDENLTQFFIVPAGATPPDCKDCIPVKLK